MSTRRALGFSFLDRYAALVLSIGSSMFIARLLTPAEIGVFSVTMVLLTVVSSMRDLGAGQYLVQEKELTPERIRAAWTVSLGSGLLCAAVVLLGAHPVAAFYGDPRIVDIMVVIAFNFMLNPFGSLTYAWLMREMRFDALAVMRFVAGLAGAGTAVYLAWAGHGPISLAYGSLASTVCNGLAAIRYRPRHFSWLPGLVGIRRVVAAGSKFSANGLISVIGGGAPDLLIGKLQSLADAAIYSRANGLAAMFQKLVLDATQVVAMPMLARQSREHGDITESFVRAVSYVTALGWSFFLGLALLAYPAVRLLYGFQWDESVGIARIVAVAYVLGLPASLCAVALIASGAPGTMVRTSAVTTALLIAAMAVGASIGLRAAALALLVSSAAGTVIWLRATQRVTRFDWRQLHAALLRSAGVAVLTASAPALVVAAYGWRPQERALPLLLATLGGGAAFVAAVLALNHPLRAELTKAWGQFRPALL